MKFYTFQTIILFSSFLYAENHFILKTHARVVPERLGDFAWENDLIAFRVYGPKLRNKPENNGIDCWLKRVKYPIIDKWYSQMKYKSYHKDHGEGHDPYSVGSSAGCGGTGIWLNSKRYPLETYINQEIISSNPERSQFQLNYKNTINGIMFEEEKIITIELGKRLFSVHSKFTRNGKNSVNLPICIGLTTHEGKAETFFHKKRGWIACWEKISDSSLGTAVMTDPKRIDIIKEVKSGKKDQDHIFIIMKTDENGSLEYKAGYGWKKAGDITDKGKWKNYLDSIKMYD